MLAQYYAWWSPWIFGMENTCNGITNFHTHTHTYTLSLRLCLFYGLQNILNLWMMKPLRIMEYHKAQNQWGIHLITSSLRLSMPMYFFSLSSRYGIAKCFGCRIFFISHSRKWHVLTNLAAITFHILKNELNASLVVVLFVCLINLFIFRFVFISLDSKKNIS